MASVRDFGAKGDGLADDTDAFQHAIRDGGGRVVLPPGDYVVRRTLQVPLDKLGRFSMSGEGGNARVLWHGGGPLLHLIGTHPKTALPADFAEGVWRKERMPTITGFEIVGQTPQSDGVRLEGTMQPTLHLMLIRRCRHGVHLVKRNRNVLIADCHVYDNNGVGVFLDRVNLHQINIHGNHISYCKRGGIVVAGSEVRNIQICSNDIEYNFDAKENDCSDVWFDARAGTIREGTITGNTIQAKVSPGGANVRFTGKPGDATAVGMIAVAGNLIGSQETSLLFQSCRGISVCGNAIYHGERHAVLAEDSEHLVFDGNSHDHNPEYKGKSTDAHVFRRCRNLNLTGLLIQHTAAPADPIEASVVFSNCENVSVMGCQIIDPGRRALMLEKCRVARIANCTIRRSNADAFVASLAWDDTSSGLMVANNFLAKGADGVHPAARDGVAISGNVAV